MQFTMHERGNGVSFRLPIDIARKASLDAQAHHLPVQHMYHAVLTHFHRGGAYNYLWRKAGKAKISLWFPDDELPALPNSDDVYFNVHPCVCIPSTNAEGKLTKPEKVRGRIEHVAAINCLFSEFDDLSFETIQAIKPEPSYIVQSSPGKYHVYWFLRDTFIIDTDDDRQHARALQAAWVRHTGGDDAAKDLARVLRVPGTYNTKYTPKQFVEEIFVDFDNQYTIEELEQYCADLAINLTTSTPHTRRVPLSNSNAAPSAINIDFLEVAYWTEEKNKRYLVTGLKKAIQACRNNGKITLLDELLNNKTVKKAYDKSNSNWRSIIVHGIAMLGFRAEEIYTLADYLIRKYKFDRIEDKGLPHHVNDITSMIAKYKPCYRTSKYSSYRHARYKNDPIQPTEPAATCASRTGRKPHVTAQVLEYYKNNIAASNQVHATQEAVAAALKISLISVKRADKVLTEQGKIQRGRTRGKDVDLSYVNIFEGIKTSPNEAILMEVEAAILIPSNTASESLKTQIKSLSKYIRSTRDDTYALTPAPNDAACTPYFRKDVQTCTSTEWREVFGDVGVPLVPVISEHQISEVMDQEDDPYCDIPFSTDLVNPDYPFDNVDQDVDQGIFCSSITTDVLPWAVDEEHRLLTAVIRFDDIHVVTLDSHITALTPPPQLYQERHKLLKEKIHIKAREIKIKPLKRRTVSLFRWYAH